MEDIEKLFSDELRASALSHSQLYRMVYDQLRKDFHPHIQINEAPEELTASWLYGEVSVMLSDLLKSSGNGLSAVLYRVDIKESILKKAMLEASPEQKLEKLTWLILKREAQKVWIRSNFKSTGRSQDSY